MATIYGGDEVNAVVLDLGTQTCKAGYAGDDTPKAVFPSLVGVISGAGEAANGVAADQPSGMEVDGQGPSGRKLYAGNIDFAFRREHMELKSPFGPDDLVQDWDLVAKIWDHAFRERLRVNPEESAVLLSEPTHNDRAGRERCVEMLFESCRCPAVFLARSAVLASFAVGRQSSLVVDAGYRGVTVSAVHDGYSLAKSMVRNKVGGKLLTHVMQKVVEAQAGPIRPRYTFKRVEKSVGNWEVEPVDAPATTSFRAFHVEAVAADVKETLCRVNETRLVADEGSAVPSVAYELPDGTEIHVGVDRFKIPELMFQPHLIKTYDGVVEAAGLTDATMGSITDMVSSSIGRCDVDIRRDMFNGVVLTGGTSLFAGVRDRLERELGEQAMTGAKVKVTCPINPTERRFSTWIGGSILASLGSFQQMWMSKQEFEEHGAALISRKAP